MGEPIRTPVPSHFKNHAITWAVVLIAIATLARLLFLSADPSLLVSTAHVTDEGWWSQNARNHFLFGEWVMDEHNPGLVMTPAYSIAQRLVFEVAGSSFFAVRLLGALSVISAVLLVGVRLQLRPRWAMGAAALVATNPLLFAYSRVAFVEPFQLLGIAGCWFFSTGSPKRGANALLSGVFAVLAVAAKPTAAPIVLMCLLAPWIHPANLDWRSRLKSSLIVVVGGLLSVAGVFVFLLPHWSTFLVELSRESRLIGSENGYSGLAMPLLIGLEHADGRLEAIPGYWLAIAPLLVLLAIRVLARVPRTGQSVASADESLTAVVRVTTAWLILGLAVLMIQSPLRSAPRYWINLLVPAAVLLFAPFDRSSGTGPWSRRISVGLACVAISFVFRPQYMKLIHWQFPDAQILGSVLLLGFLVIVGSFVLWVALQGLRSRDLIRAGIISKVDVVASAAVVAFWAVFCAALLVGATFTLRDSSRQIGAQLDGSEAVLTGRIANTMSLETQLFAYETRDLSAMRMGQGVLNSDPEALGATHIVSTVEVEGETRDHDLPLAAAFQPVSRFQLVPATRYRSGYRYIAQLAELHLRPGTLTDTR